MYQASRALELHREKKLPAVGDRVGLLRDADPTAGGRGPCVFTGIKMGRCREVDGLSPARRVYTINNIISGRVVDGGWEVRREIYCLAGCSSLLFFLHTSHFDFGSRQLSLVDLLRSIRNYAWRSKLPFLRSHGQVVLIGVTQKLGTW